MARDLALAEALALRAGMAGTMPVLPRGREAIRLREELSRSTRIAEPPSDDALPLEGCCARWPVWERTGIGVGENACGGRRQVSVGEAIEGLMDVRG